MNLGKLDEVIRVNPFYAKLETDGYNIQFEMSGGTKEIRDYKGDIRCEKRGDYPIEKDFRDFAEKMLRKYGKRQGASRCGESSYVVFDNDERKFVESVGAAGVFYTDDLDSAFQFPDEESANDCKEFLKNAVLLQWL